MVDTFVQVHRMYNTSEFSQKLWTLGDRCVHGEAVCVCGGAVVLWWAVYGKISLLSAQFCYEPTTALKKQSPLEKKKQGIFVLFQK